MGCSIFTGIGSTRFVTTLAGLSQGQGVVPFDASTLPHDSRQSRGLARSFGALATVDTGAIVAAGLGERGCAGWLAISVQLLHGVFDLNSLPMNVCRSGDGVPLTHEDGLHGPHAWPQLLQHELHAQFEFGGTIPPATGLRRSSGTTLVVLLYPPEVGAEEYWITGVPKGVRDDGLLGTTGAVWPATVDVAGLLLVKAGIVVPLVIGRTRDCGAVLVALFFASAGGV